MGIYLKRYHQEKPPLGSQINWRHPLSQGLVGCWLMNENSGGKIIDLSSKLNHSTAFSTKWSRNINGITTKYSGSQYIDVAKNSIPTVNPITIFCKVIIPSRVVGKIVTKWENSGSLFDWLLYESDTIGTVRFYQNVTGTSESRFHGVAGALVVGKDTTICVSASGGHNFMIFTNGSFSTGDTSDGNYVLGVGAGVTIGAGRNGASRDAPFTGDISVVYIYNRIIQRTEVLSLYEAPYQFIQPFKNRIYSFLAPSAVTLPNPQRSMTGVKSIQGVKSVTF